jgi:toxin ParE1/3/4
VRKIHTQALAKQDLKNIWLYSFKNWGEKQADSYFDELHAAIALIAENPEIGFACNYIREGYRQYHINRHFVFYRITATKIHIVRVLHDSMNFKAHSLPIGNNGSTNGMGYVTHSQR